MNPLSNLKKLILYMNFILYFRMEEVVNHIAICYILLYY